MPVTVTAILTSDIRFPTSLALDRSDVAAGWTHFKIKVDRNVDEDIRRARIMREQIRPDRVLMVDANAYPNGSAWVALRRTEKVTA
jgi:L-alanine-DL-glutamate epimerase-like enolase superfamily enzyme